MVEADAAVQGRYRITFRLRAGTALRIGDGTEVAEEALRKSNDRQEDAAPLVGQLMRDHRGLPYIPGTTLKGRLRAWLRRGSGVDPQAVNYGDPDQIDGLLGWPAAPGPLDRDADGRPKEPNKLGAGGRAAFHPAFLEAVPLAMHAENRLTPAPYWRPEEASGVHSSVGISRQTGAAKRHHLFHQRVVPRGTVFAGEITGRNLDREDLRILILALRGFDDEQSPILLGAETANGMGRLRLQDEPRILTLDSRGLGEWLDHPFRRVGDHVLQQRPSWTVEAGDAKETVPIPLRLSFTLKLAFDGPFLVNDTSRTGESDEEQKPNHYPRLDGEGRVVLPARSFRGAVRSQAERIARTLNPAAEGDPFLKRNRDGAAEQLGLVESIFGTTGWRTGLDITEFVSQKPAAKLLRQEFVAIDRFTGGAAKGLKNNATKGLKNKAERGLKFNAEYVHAPTVSGQITVDLDRIGPEAFGLLVLVFRDLTEGDITFGWGTGKGYGTVRDAAISDLRVDGTPSGLWQTSIHEALTASAQKDPGDLREVTKDRRLWQPILRHVVAQFREATKSDGLTAE